MSKALTASDRKTLIRLASSMEKGSEERKAILAGLEKTTVSKSVRDWERLLAQLIEEGDQLGRAAQGFGARVAMDMSVSEAMTVLDGYADNLAKLENYISSLTKAAKGAPDVDKDALDALLKQGHSQKWEMGSALHKAKQALAQYEKETTRGKLRAGFKRLVGLAEAQWPEWRLFTVTADKPLYVKDAKGGYGKATLTIKGLDLSGEDTEIDLGYRASTGEMWGYLNGKEVFRKVGGKWPLKTLLKDVSRKYPMLTGNCDVSTFHAPNVEKMVEGWAKAKHPNVDLSVVDKGGKRWEFWVDGEKVGDAAISGYTGWGNTGYYDIGGDRYDYDKWSSSQCPPSIDTKKFWNRLMKYLSGKIKGIQPPVYMAPDWDGDTRRLWHRFQREPPPHESLKRVYSVKELKPRPPDERYHPKGIPGGWVGTSGGQWITPRGTAPMGAWGYFPTPFKSKSDAKATIDKMIQEVEDRENERRRK